jgi:hypothetical protein
MNPRDPALTTIPKRPDLVCWTSGRIKTIVSRLGLVEAYDLERDPGEVAPLSLTAEEIAAALARARAWWDDHPVEAASRVNDEDTERLRALGYMDDED